MTDPHFPSLSPLKDDASPSVMLGGSGVRNPYKKTNDSNEYFYDNDPMAPQIVAPLKSGRTLQGYSNGIILYDQFAQQTNRPLFETLDASDIEPPNFKNLAMSFVAWIVAGNARMKSGKPYSLDAGTLPQYFSNWYNAICHDDRFSTVLLKDPIRKWHEGMTEQLTRRLKDDANEQGVIKAKKNTTLRRSTFIELVRQIIKHSQTDARKQRDAWQVW